MVLAIDTFTATPNPVKLEEKMTVTVTISGGIAPGNWCVIGFTGHDAPFMPTFTLPAINNTQFQRDIYGWQIGHQDSIYDSIRCMVWAGGELVGGLINDGGSGYTVNEPDEPFTPVIQYLLNWIETDAVLKDYAKVFQELKKPFVFITTRPQFLVYTEEGPLEWWTVGGQEMQYDSIFLIIFIDDLRRKVDFSRHYTFIKRVVDHIRNNPTLGGTVGVLNAECLDYEMPGQRTESIYLHKSILRVGINLLPEYP
jgi:hypothetical protein